MIKLSKRLAKISTLIGKDDIVLDIGCDHALLDIYLERKFKKKFYASDLRESALDMARSNIKKYDAKDVEIRCGNGLEVINENDTINTIVISGMGYMTINKILKDINKYKKINKIIIQSNTNPELVRKHLVKNGFYIYKDYLVLDNNKYYIITYFKKGIKKHTPMELEVGIFDDSRPLKKYITLEIKKNNILLTLIPKKYVFKRYRIEKTINYLNKKKNSIYK